MEFIEIFFFTNFVPKSELKRLNSVRICKLKNINELMVFTYTVVLLGRVWRGNVNKQSNVSIIL